MGDQHHGPALGPTVAEILASHAAGTGSPAKTAARVADAITARGDDGVWLSTVPRVELIAAAEAIARTAGLDVGGVEYLVDDRDGVPRFYDVNALSNFVARPLEVLGWDPHDRLVEHLIGIIGTRKAAA